MVTYFYKKIKLHFLRSLKLLNIFVLFNFILLSTSNAHPNPTHYDYRYKQFESLIETYVNAGLFTGTVLIAENGKVIFLKSYGLANREHEVKNSEITKFRIGSITKQFTASAIMILQQEGLLSVHDPISKYLPDYPQGDKITIHHLLTHTSGIPNYTEFPDFDNFSKNKHSLEDIVNYFKHYPLNFLPGENWSYSNSGYAVLGLIIEKISDMDYEEFIQKRIFQDANLINSLADNPRKLIANRAQGYDVISMDDVRNANYIHLSSTQASGNMLSTAMDLYKWDQVLYGTSILTDKSKSEMFKDQTNTGYGYGWCIDQMFGHKRVRHGGAIHGFLTEYARYVDADVTIITLNNSIAIEPNHGIADELAAIVFYQLPSKQKNYFKKSPEKKYRRDLEYY